MERTTANLIPWRDLGVSDALKSTMEHLHWYEGQLALRKEKKPGTAALAAIAACFGVGRFDGWNGRQ